jgi:hypothetical protein
MTWRALPPIFEVLRSSGFRDLNGSRVATTLSIAEPLLNAVVSASLPPSGAVRELVVHPLAGDRFSIRAKLARPEFLPPINATVAIARQPELPEHPTLLLRVTGFAGLLAMAGPLLSLAPKLPPGIRLDKDLLTVDLRQLLAERGQEDLLRLLQRIAVHSEESRVLIDVEAAVS